MFVSFLVIGSYVGFVYLLVAVQPRVSPLKCAKDAAFIGACVALTLALGKLLLSGL